ncbi:TonB-dependent receptor domain-containing protein [Sphingopyxis sp. LARHCG72]
MKKAYLPLLKLTAAPLVLSVVMLSAPAHAQDAAATEEASEDTIVVTGSRIGRPELEGSSPVQVLGEASILQQGSQNISDVLNEMPSIGTGIGRTNSNFLTSGNGVATVNLRNLGNNRTLVLVNGRRVAAGLGGTSAVDINNIPTDLLQRVEVLTGGSSAVYGSEAMAGVVNFILKDDFEGIRGRAQAGITDEGDNGRQMLGLTVGKNFADGRGNITLAGQYDRDTGLRSYKRAISAEDVPFRSGFTPQGRFFVGDTSYTYDPAGNLKEGYNAPVDGYNRNGDRYIAVPLERYLLNGLAHYDINDSLTFFAEGTYAKVKSRSRLEPYAFDNSDAQLPDGTMLPGLAFDNPFIPQALLDRAAALNSDANPDNNVSEIGFTKRFNGVFDRSNRADREFYRAVAGLRGTLFGDWKWDAYYNRSQTVENTASETALRDRLYYALDAVGTSPATAVCRDAAARAAGCKPFNIFGAGTASPESVAYITNNGQLSTYKAKINQEVFAFNTSGSVFRLPGGDVKVAGGIEHRTERSSEVYDAATQTGNTLSNMLANTTGKYRVFEAYGETVVPILSDVPFAEYLGLEAAVRYGDYYDTVGSVWSYKIGGDWAPTSDIRFRAVYSRATRAPNIGELYQGASQTFPSGLVDPCNGVTATSNREGSNDAYCRTIPGIAQQIAANGVFRYNPNSDTQSIEGEDSGNLNLKEETAKTWTAGVVFTPSFVPGLSVTVDYFNIKVKDAIQLIPRQSSVNECVMSGGTSPLCALIVREQVGTPRPRTPGTLYQINAYPINSANIETAGVDVQARYKTSWGEDSSLDVALLYTYLDKLTLQSFAGGDVQDNRGQLDGDGRLGAGFKHRANLSVTYQTGPFSLNWRTNYQSKMQDTLGGNPGLGDENSIKAYWYHDVQARFAVDKDRLEFYAGIDNLFDKKPPVINQNGASNITGTETAADSYDPFGRNLYVGAVFRF